MASTGMKLATKRANRLFGVAIMHRWGADFFSLSNVAISARNVPSRLQTSTPPRIKALHTQKDLLEQDLRQQRPPSACPLPYAEFTTLSTTSVDKLDTMTVDTS